MQANSQVKKRNGVNILYFSVYEYSIFNDRGWFLKITGDDSLPRDMQRQKVIRKNRINSDEVLSNYKGFYSRLEVTDLRGVFTGDFIIAGTNRFFIAVFTGRICTIYLFETNILGKQDRLNLARKFMIGLTKNQG